MTEITITEITSGFIEGSGAFDEIMKSNQLRLEQEYQKDRIKGTEYSKVYLGAMEAAMAQSVAFVLGRQQASAQADLTILQGDLLAVELLNAKKQGELIDQQILKMKAEVNILEKELIMMDSKIALAEQEVLKSIQEVINLEAQLPQILAQTGNIQQDTKLKIQQEANLVKDIEKATQEILVLEQQVLSAIENVRLVTAQVEKIDQEIKVMTWQTYSAEAQIKDTYSEANIPVSGLMGKQIDKMKQEGELLLAKKYTEQSQTKDSVDGSLVAGMIGKQKNLYQAQTSGFARDAEQKLAKIMSDSFAVRRSTDEAAVPPDNLNNESIDVVLEKAGTGIGVTL